MKKELLLTICITAILSGCGDSKNNEERTKTSTNTVVSESTDVVTDIDDDNNDGGADYDEPVKGSWETNTCHNDKYQVTVNSKTSGHPDGNAMSLNEFSKERNIGEFVEKMNISVGIHFCNDDLLTVHPDYMDYTPVNCFGMDGYYNEIHGEDYYEFMDERDTQMTDVDDKNGIAVFFPCYDDMYLVAVVEYHSSFIKKENGDEVEYYDVKDGIIYDENDNACGNYEEYDLKELFSDPEFIEFDEIEVTKL